MQRDVFTYGHNASDYIIAGGEVYCGKTLEKLCDSASHVGLTGVRLNADGLCTRATDHGTVDSRPWPEDQSDHAVERWARIADHHGVPRDAGWKHLAKELRQRAYVVQDTMLTRVVFTRRYMADRSEQSNG